MATHFQFFSNRIKSEEEKKEKKKEKRARREARWRRKKNSAFPPYFLPETPYPTSALIFTVVSAHPFYQADSIRQRNREEKESSQREREETEVGWGLKSYAEKSGGTFCRTSYICLEQQQLPDYSPRLNFSRFILEQIEKYKELPSVVAGTTTAAPRAATAAEAARKIGGSPALCAREKRLFRERDFFCC